LEKIRDELQSLKDYWVVLYGSCVTGDDTPRSDIDIAVITRIDDDKKNSKLWLEILGKIPPRYDVKIFELLPLNIKAEIMSNYIVIFGDALEISEYFYQYWKLWRDMKYRYEENRFKSQKERIAGLKNRQKIISKK